MEGNFTFVICIKNLLRIGLHLDVYELVFFKLGMMIGMTKVDISSQCKLPRPSVKVTRFQEIWNFCINCNHSVV